MPGSQLFCSSYAKQDGLKGIACVVVCVGAPSVPIPPYASPPRPQRRATTRQEEGVVTPSPTLSSAAESTLPLLKDLPVIHAEGPPREPVVRVTELQQFYRLSAVSEGRIRSRLTQPTWLLATRYPRLKEAYPRRISARRLAP